MNVYKELLNRRLDALRRQPGVVIRAQEVGDGIDEQSVSQLAAEIPFDLAPELLDFYREMNGVELSWSMNQPGGEIVGSIVILPLRKGLFGYPEKVERVAYEGAFEDVLWNRESFSGESIAELKQHRVFEIIEGQPANITYKPAPGQVKLFYVDEEDIAPIRVNFPDYIKSIFQYLGAGHLREYLTNEEWEQKIRGDEKLQAVARWEG